MDLYTKQDFQAALEQILAPIRATLLTSRGHPDFGHTATVYCRDAIDCESFLRQLWGLVPYWQGGGGDEELKAAVRAGIIAGTDPHDPAYWGSCTRYDQRFVEMAPLACGLLAVPEILWDPLTDTEKDNLVSWLWEINGQEIPPNNWRFFRILVNTALKKLGRPYSADTLREDHEAIESFYMDDGWYGDGKGGQRDYYVAWALHFYGLIYSLYEQDDYAARYIERARIFAKEFIYWFSDKGDSIPYGRSLTYRFAQGSFWSMCVVAGVDVFDLGTLKGILSRHLSDWLEAPIFGYGGELSIGYKYPNLTMAEHYNAPGSPYWSLKFFAHLALADDHPFWAAGSKPMPPLEARKCLPVANMLVMREGGDTFAYPAGTIVNAAFGQMGAKYLKFAYTTRFGINLKLGDVFPVEALTDSTLSFDIGGVFCDRRTNKKTEVFDDHLVITWSPVEGITVTTTLTPTETSHTRHHVVESDFACTAYDCGFSVANRDTDGCSQTTTPATAHTPHTAEAKNNFSLCRVTSDTADATPMVINTQPNANIVFNKTVLPCIKYHIPRGRTEFTTTITHA